MNKAPWRPGKSPSQPWYVRRVRYFDSQGRRCTTFKVRWWVRRFVKTESVLSGPYFENKRDVRRWWYNPTERKRAHE